MINFNWPSNESTSRGHFNALKSASPHRPQAVRGITQQRPPHRSQSCSSWANILVSAWTKVRISYLAARKSHTNLSHLPFGALVYTCNQDTCQRHSKEFCNGLHLGSFIEISFFLRLQMSKINLKI